MYGSSDSGGGFVAVVCILFFGGLLFAKCAMDVSGTSHQDAQQQANKWIKAQGLTATAQCANVDSDGDGYISCTLVMTNPDGSKSIEPLECTGSMTINEGCRYPKVNLGKRR